MKNWQVTGYHVFLELLKLIHFNPKLPEFQNVYMTDRNREKFMSYDGKIWELNDLALYETTQHIEKLKNAYEEEFEEEIKLNKSVKHTIDKLNKFTDKYFEGDEEGNKNNEFIKLVNGQIMDYMYNHREDIKINFEQIKDEIIKKNNDKLALNK
jgi:gas vesicle protein